MAIKKVASKPVPEKSKTKEKVVSKPAPVKAKAPEKVLPKVEPVKTEKRADLGRNDPCYCGSGKKYKKCHLFQDEAAEWKKHSQDAALEKEMEPEKKGDKPAHEKHEDKRRSIPSRTNTNTATRTLFKRKIGDG